MNRERLLVLAEFLDKLPPERFDLSQWASGDLNLCGTVGCALGWATQIPEFKALGLRMSVSNYGYGTQIHIDGSIGGARNAAYTIFGLQGDEFEILFLPSIFLKEDESYQFDEVTGEDMRGQLDRHATPSEVATHIRRFINK